MTHSIPAGAEVPGVKTFAATAIVIADMVGVGVFTGLVGSSGHKHLLPRTAGVDGSLQVGRAGGPTGGGGWVSIGAGGADVARHLRPSRLREYEQAG